MVNIWHLKVDGKDLGHVHMTEKRVKELKHKKGIEIEWVAEMSLKEFHGEEKKNDN